MANKKKPLPILKVPKNASLRQIYAIARRQFSAADLQKYTVIEPMMPADELLAELKVIHREETRALAKESKIKKAKRKKS